MHLQVVSSRVIVIAWTEFKGGTGGHQGCPCLGHVRKVMLKHPNPERLAEKMILQKNY